MPEYPINAAVLRHLRRTFAVTPRQLARLLRVGKSSVHRYEIDGGPPWLLLALGGLGVMRYGMGVAEIAAHMGLDPDADPPRHSSGTFAPVLPTREPIDMQPEDAMPAPPHASSPG
jgi:hypothetical protein